MEIIGRNAPSTQVRSRPGTKGGGGGGTRQDAWSLEGTFMWVLNKCPHKVSPPCLPPPLPPSGSQRLWELGDPCHTQPCPLQQRTYFLCRGVISVSDNIAVFFFSTTVYINTIPPQVQMDHKVARKPHPLQGAPSCP